MDILHLDLALIRNHYSVESLSQAMCKHESGVVMKVPCPSFGNATWNIDLAHDYLSVLFVGEEIADFCETIRVDHKLPGTIFYVFRSSKSDDLAHKLVWLSGGFDDDLWWGDADFEEVQESIQEFAVGLDSRSLRFPELGDKYFANYLPGIEQIGNSEDIESMYLKYPERQFGFWRSCVSKELEYDLYVSPWAWIILNDPNSDAVLRDVTKSLKRYGGFENELPIMTDAYYLSINDLPPVVLNDSTMVRFSIDGLREAQRCATALWNEIFRSKGPELQFETGSRIFQAIQGMNEKMSLSLSENGYLLVASDALAQYVFFAEMVSLNFIEYEFLRDTDSMFESVPIMWEVPQKFQAKYWDAIDRLSEALGSLSGNPIDVSLDWDQLDDEAFELLCYDILGQVEKFDPDSRQKMGKSRSRDGGRDIIVYSRSRLGNPPCKWIVQCKLVKPNHSLSGASVDVLTPVARYGAQGFCIMTNAIIDSTLYDTLEDVASNLSIKYENDLWSRLRIERFLARPQHRNIRKRYFRGA